MSEIFHMVFDI